MNPRIKLSILLIGIGGIMAFLPLSANRSFTVKPDKVLSAVLDEETFITVDQVARFVISEDSTIQLIDLRPANEYFDSNIPGSANIPYDEFLEKAPGIFLSNKSIRYILYSNGDLESNYAFTMASGLNCKNIFVMKGGLNEWFDTVMNSSFSGGKISARENALFESRARASKMFTDMNSLPDSLKVKYMESRRMDAKKLDGGCD